MTPEPLLRSSAGSVAAAFVSSSGGVYPVTKIWTTLGLIRSTSSSSERDRSFKPASRLAVDDAAGCDGAVACAAAGAAEAISTRAAAHATPDGETDIVIDSFSDSRDTLRWDAPLDSIAGDRKRQLSQTPL